MSNVIPSYPMIGDEKLSDSNVKIEDYEFLYTKNDGLEKKLNNISDEESIIVLDDELGIWSLDNENLFLKRKFSIEKPYKLFGENGVADELSEIGLAIQWYSSSTKLRGVIKVGNFGCSYKPVSIFLKHKFEKGSIKGSISLSTIFYISKKTPNSNLEYLANEVGEVVGEYDKIEVILDGDGSTFPIYEEELDNTYPRLWYLNMSWDDPTYDSFNDNFSITLNKNHKNYKFLDKNSKFYDSQLMIEIVTTSLSTLILTLKNDFRWNDIINNENLLPGSIGEMVVYYINTLNWSLDSPESIVDSINRFCNEEFGK